jgi:NhaA family Na+:H+ antiporter
MSLFISELAFKESPLLDVAKLGILAGSLVAGIGGWLILRGASSPSGPSKQS